jgi:isopenicillin-N epimerase
MRQHWTLDPDVVFLNHGAFGACPAPVLLAQARIKAQLEREPVYFFERCYEPLLDAARETVAAFVGAPPEDVAFVNNTTTGVSAILRSLDFSPGDRILMTDHTYNACKNAIEYVASRTGAEVVVARVPLPVSSPDEFQEHVLRAVTPGVRLALIDHVTSPTGLVLPIEAIVRSLRERGVETLVDGAHAPGMVDLEVARLGAAYYVGNFHKWVCSPKGAAFVHVRKDRKEGLHPTVISHGYSSTRPKGRFQDEFAWSGSDDPSAWLAVPDAIAFMGGLLPGGWPALRSRNRALALAARKLISETLGAPLLAPESMIGSLAAIPLPDAPAGAVMDPVQEPLHRALYDRHRIQVPVFVWPRPPTRLLRVAAQAYCELPDYEKLAGALRQELGDAR